MYLLNSVFRNIKINFTIIRTSTSANKNRDYSGKTVFTNEEIPDSIQIPKRIHRSPTDILCALAATVGRDPTAPHYKYHDDPYLIPATNVNKRIYAMAQESGRKAAKWIKEQHSDLFLHKEAQPNISAFAPKIVFTENSEVSNDTLQNLIQMSEVNDAMFVYQLLKQKNLPISDDTKQSLLEMLCFYNHEDPLPEDLYEERTFLQNNDTQDRKRKTWKDGDLAEQLFNEMEPKNEKMYAALIRGMAKYYQVEVAYALFQEALDKEYRLDTESFNSIISILSLLNENVDMRWNLCKELLLQMNQLELIPNLGTLNSVLECISTFGHYKLARDAAIQSLAEFRNLGIVPSLGTYYYILIIFCREKGPVSPVLVDILNEIEDKEFEIQCPEDTFFFTTAMDVCRNHLHDITLARKVNDILNFGKNYDLIGDSFKESIYYRHYFALLSQTVSVEEFMQIYDSLVPNVYIPEPGIMEDILSMIEMNAAFDLLPRLWSDMTIFEHTYREILLAHVLKIMICYKPDTEKPDRDLSEQFVKITYDIYQIIEESQNRNKKLSFTGEMIGYILTLLLRENDFEKAVEVFSYIDKNQHRIPGTPNDTCLEEFINACIMNKSPSQALLCLEYAVENNMVSLQLAKNINEGFTLNEADLSKLKSLIGDNIFTQ